jgi:hypothetical protein
MASARSTATAKKRCAAETAPDCHAAVAAATIDCSIVQSGRDIVETRLDDTGRSNPSSTRHSQIRSCRDPASRACGGCAQ